MKREHNPRHLLDPAELQRELLDRERLLLSRARLGEHAGTLEVRQLRERLENKKKLYCN